MLLFFGRNQLDMHFILDLVNRLSRIKGHDDEFLKSTSFGIDTIVNVLNSDFALIQDIVWLIPTSKKYMKK